MYVSDVWIMFFFKYLHLHMVCVPDRKTESDRNWGGVLARGGLEGKVLHTSAQEL